MKRLVMLFVLATMVASAMQSYAAPVFGTFSDPLSRLAVSVSYVQSLGERDNTTAVTASWSLIKTGRFGADVDILAAPDMEDFLLWGAGVSGTLKGDMVDLKLGVGYFDKDWVGYVSFPMIGGTSTNLMGTPKSETFVANGGITTDGFRVTGQWKF